MKNYRLIIIIALFVSILSLSIAFIAYSKVNNYKNIKEQIYEKNYL